MKTSDLVVSKFIRKQDVMDKPMTLTIADVSQEASGMRGKQAVLWFEETTKGLGLNNTKIKSMEVAFGYDTDQWHGHRVRLVYDPDVKMGTAVVGGIKLVCSSKHVGGAAPAGAPPPPVWDAGAQQWVFQQPPPAAAALPTAPAWDPVAHAWIMPDGSVMAPGAPPRAAQPASTNTGALDAGRAAIAAAQAPARAAAPSGHEEFDDDIPF